MVIFVHSMQTLFGTWLKIQLDEKGISQAELARRIQMQPSQVSHIISGERGTTPEGYLAIARALSLPPEIIYRAAGLLPPKPETDEQVEEIMHEATQLNEAEREELLAYIRMKRNLREKQRS